MLDLVNKSFQNAIWNILPSHKDTLFDDILKNRPDIKDSLDPQFNDLSDPFLMSDMSQVVAKIKEAIHQKQKILIYGDYDVDGMMSALLLYETLVKIGADVSYFLPHRVNDGYGINKQNIEKFSKHNIDLIITVDNGITGVDEVEYAKSLGVDIIITDHHNPHETLPDCLILNPKKPHCPYPYKGLVGAGVVYKLLQALYISYPEEIFPWFVKMSLDIVALATVVDCGSLTGENRIMTALGILALKNGKRKGIELLMKKIGKKKNEIDVYTLGFQIGPRCNASGRLDDPTRVVDMFLSNNDDSIQKSVDDLEYLNDDRKHEVENALLWSEEIKQQTPTSIIVFHEDWSEGIVGLIAGQLAEKYHRPVFAMTKSGEHIVGSIRNPLKSINIVEILEQSKDLLLKFGGHNQAAGFSLKTDKKEDFIQSIQKTCDQNIIPKNLQKKYVIDATFLLDTHTLQDIQSIQKLAPFGLGNPTPLFIIQNICIKDIRIIGKTQDHISFTVYDKSHFIKCIAFGKANWQSHIDMHNQYDVIGKIKIEEWNGRVSLKMFVEDVRRVEN